MNNSKQSWKKLKQDVIEDQGYKKFKDDVLQHCLDKEFYKKTQAHWFYIKVAACFMVTLVAITSYYFMFVPSMSKIFSSNPKIAKKSHNLDTKYTIQSKTVVTVAKKNIVEIVNTSKMNASNKKFRFAIISSKPKSLEVVSSENCKVSYLSDAELIAIFNNVRGILLREKGTSRLVLKDSDQTTKYKGM